MLLEAGNCLADGRANLILDLLLESLHLGPIDFESLAQAPNGVPTPHGGGLGEHLGDTAEARGAAA